MADRRPRSNRGASPRRPTARPARREAASRPRGARGGSVGPGGGPVSKPVGDAQRPRLTGRAAILILLIAVLTVSYASSMRAYLQQRGHISDLKSQIAERSASISSLEREKKRWTDDAFLEQQARERFGFLFPGETGYQVIDSDGKVLDGAQTLDEASEVVKHEPTPWWDTAWHSVELAGNPPKANPGPAAPGR